MYSANKIRVVNETSGVKKSPNKNFSSPNRDLQSHSAPHQCLLAILKCPLSVSWRCPSSREFGYGKMTEKRLGPAPGVRLIKVSIKRKLTVLRIWQGFPKFPF